MPGNIPVHSNKYIFISVHTAGKKARFDQNIGIWLHWKPEPMSRMENMNIPNHA
jgi:hypothetical protein